MTARRWIFLALTILWMIVIFLFSARTGGESTQDSYGIGYTVAHILHADFDEWSETEQLSYVESLDHGIRKTAHACEYGILAVFVALAVVASIDKSLWKRMLVSWGITTAYAITDEIHQLFVPGRSGQLTDVVIDSIGAFVFLLLIIAIIALFFRKKVAYGN